MQRTLNLLAATLCLCASESAAWQRQPGADVYPALAFLGNGEWLCAWVTNADGMSPTIALARSADGANTWTQPQRPFTSREVSCGLGLSILFGQNQRLCICGCSKQVVSDDRGVTWDIMPRPVSYRVEPYLSYSRAAMVEGADGILGLAYVHMFDRNFAQTDVYAVFSFDGGETWQQPFLLSTEPPRDTFRRYNLPVLATDKTGQWLAFWNGNNAFHSRRSTDNGKSWTEPEVVLEHDEKGTDIDKPEIAVSKSGCWLMIWRTWTDGGDGPFGPSYVKAMRSIDAGATWNNYAILNLPQAENFSTVGGLHMATDHKGHWVVVWQARVPANGKVPKDLDICYVTSSDDARTWSEPKTLNTNAETDVGDDMSCFVATHSEGTWVAAWHSTDTLCGRIGRDTDILYSISKDNGGTWSDPAPLNTDAEVGPQHRDPSRDIQPHIATDGKGCFLAVWSSQGHQMEKYGLDSDLLVSSSLDNGQTWSLPTPANADAATDVFDDVSPRVAVSDSGVWMLAWVRQDNDLIRHFVAVAYSTDQGVGWSNPHIISNSTDFFNSPGVAPGKDGAWAAVFSSHNLGGTYVAQVCHSYDDGASWDKPMALSDGSDNFFGETTIVSGLDDQWIAVWRGSSFGADTYQPQLRISADNKTWEPAVSLSEGFAHNPQLSTGEVGHLIVASVNAENHAKEMAAAVRRSSDNGRTWTEPEVLGEKELRPITTAYGGNGKWIGVVSPMHYYERVSPEPIYLTSSSDNGLNWTARKLFQAGETAVKGAAAHIVSDRKGSYITIWQSAELLDTDPLKEWDIFTSFSSDNGQSWSEPFQLDERH